MYVCVYIYIYIYTYISLFLSIYTYIYIYIYVYIHMYTIRRVAGSPPYVGTRGLLRAGPIPSRKRAWKPVADGVGAPDSNPINLVNWGLYIM